ncbi:MAG: ArnT family glycosyltransferase [Syntrophobacteraceae bacterium]
MIQIKWLFSSKTECSVLRHILCLAALLLAVATYFHGLDGLHIPKNGDEYPYIHITRLTAASGNLLPLQSQMDNMRNTKPPLLFWQGIAATLWGKNWTLYNLRYPSVIYTILTAILTLLLARRLSGSFETGVMAALVFLAFFSTYRYGRPFLTEPALVFWLFLPLFTLLYRRPASFESRLALPLLAGLEIGIGLLYKSFALVIPICLAMSWWYLYHRKYCLKAFLAHDIWKIGLISIVSLSLFCLWFLFDPDPAAVWSEFVIGENIGKFDPQDSGYLQKLLWGSSSIWSLALGFLANGGVLVFPLAALFVLAFMTRRETTPEKTLLWLWVIALFVVFSIPSQRSGRYLIPAMPVLAVLLVLDWDKLSRKLFMLTLTCCGLLLLAFLHLSFTLNRQFSATLYEWPFWLLLAFTGGLILAGLLTPGITRFLSVMATILIYLVFSASMSPLDGPLGSFSTGVQEELTGRHVWAPSNWRAHDEPYRFLLPGSEIHDYDSGLKLNTSQLAHRYPLFAQRVPVTENPAATIRAECTDCRIIGERLDITSRHSSKELREMLLEGKLFELLFVHELLIESE